MIITTPIGELSIIIENSFLTEISFDTNISDNNFINPLMQKTQQQINDYFQGKIKQFDLPIKLHGSDFQIKVWQQLLAIPYGQTRTYNQIACAIGNKNASRAVGNACNKNPLPIIVPCHRVLGKNGALTGYNAGLEKKRFLIDLENKGTLKL